MSTGLKLDRIVTDRLVLRRVEARDTAALLEYLNDFEVTRWLARVPYPYLRQNAEEYLARQEASDEVLSYVIEYDGSAIGGVSCRDHLGYWIAAPFAGRGFATEAATAATEAYFARGHDVLESGHFHGNDASARVLTKLGFRRVGEEQLRSDATGEVHLSHKYVLERSCWEQARLDRRAS